MSWTQVHVANLPRGCQQEDMDAAFSSLFLLTEDCCWAGEGTTVMKETRSGDPFCFVAFHSADGAMKAIELLHNYAGDQPNLQNLRAAFSINSKSGGGKQKKKKGGGPNNNSGAADDSRNDEDFRLRRRRTQPARKHPIKMSSAPSKW